MGEIEQLNTFDLFIFGGTGDLANRKLLPALYKQSSIKSFSSDSRIIIIGTKNLTTEEYLQKLNKSLQEYSADYSNEMAEKFFSKISYLKIDVNNSEDWKNFSAQKYNNTRIFYLAISPALYQITTSNLKIHNCITDDSRIVVEKPIGSCLETAEKINNVLAEGICRETNL